MHACSTHGRMPETIRAHMQRWAMLSEGNSAYLGELSSHCSTLWHLVQLHSHKVGVHALQSRLCFDAERASGPAEYHNLHMARCVTASRRCSLTATATLTGINNIASSSQNYWRHFDNCMALLWASGRMHAGAGKQCMNRRLAIGLTGFSWMY